MMSPDKGHLTNVVTDDCEVGVYFKNSLQPAEMTGWALTNCYASTCPTGFYIQGCGQFVLNGISAESYTNYGVRIDDKTWGGGHILNGGLVEGAGLAWFYENPNPVNSNVILSKGSAGLATYSVWQSMPSSSLSNGAGIVVKQSSLPIFDFNSTTPRLLSTSMVGLVVSVMGRGGAFARFLCANTGGTLATGFVEILEKGTIVGNWSTAKGTATSCNVYIGTEGGVLGYYLENNSGTGFGSSIIGGVQLLLMQ
jgi:hypothetical protein